MTASYIYDKELRLIVKDEKVSSAFRPITAFPSNAYFLVSSAADKVKVVHKTITRVNSLSFQKSLELAEKAESIGKTL
jgi:hypothetical protein